MTQRFATRQVIHRQTWFTSLIGREQVIDLKAKGEPSMSDYLLTLPRDLKIRVLAKLSYLEIARLRATCKAFRELPTAEHFQSELDGAGHLQDSFSPILFFWQDNGLEWRGFSSTLQRWHRLPSLRSLLPPRSEAQTTLLKDYLVTSSHGLLCMDVSECRKAERIVLVNPVAQTVTELPPLNLRRRPVVMSLFVDLERKTYQVLVAGSAAAGDDPLSKRTEVYDSVTGVWEVKGDIPGAPYGVNLFQSGVVLNGFLFCLGVDDTHLVLAYDVNRGEWVGSWRCPFPDEFFELGCAGTNQQLFLNGKGRVVLFWEKARTAPAESGFCFASLKWHEEDGGVVEPRWGNVRVHTRRGGGGLDSYPEFVCSSSRSGEAGCVVVNTVLFTAEKYELESSEQGDSGTQPGPPALGDNEEAMYTLNPLTFSFEPNYHMAV